MVAAIVIVLVGGAGAGGWYAATAFQSPEQRAAAAAPPTPTDITVAVRQGRLEQVITAEASVTRADISTVGVPISASPAVVSGVPAAPGSRVSSGTQLLEVNGRPVFALVGQFPPFRDLAQGDHGPDVRQLQDGLRASGRSIPAKENDVFGPHTAAAVLSLYTSAGYSRDLIETTAPDEGTPAEPPAPSGRDETSPTALTATHRTGASQMPHGVSRTGDDSTAAVVMVVPRSDLMVFGHLPQTLIALPGVGVILDGDNATIQVSAGALSVASTMPAGTAMQIPEGSTVILTDPDDAQVSAISATPTGDPTQGDLTVSYLVDGDIPPQWEGTPILATITLATVADEALIVPTRAVVPGAQDRAQVLRKDDNGSLTTVPVEELGTLGGESAIRPLDPEDLRAGDDVVVR